MIVIMTSWMWDHPVIRETDTSDLALVNDQARVDNETVVWEKNRTPCICVCTQVVTKWWNYLRSNQVSQTDDEMKWQFNMVSTDPKDIAIVFPINEVITILRRISPLNSRGELIVRTVSCSFPVSMSKPQLARELEGVSSGDVCIVCTLVLHHRASVLATSHTTLTKIHKTEEDAKVELLLYAIVEKLFHL